MPNFELKPIVLNTPHTHAGVACKTGETIWVSPIIYDWLMARGVGSAPTTLEQPTEKSIKASKKAKE